VNKERHNRVYELHSWAGVLFGIIIYVVAITGCFALFQGELQPWEDTDLRGEVSVELPEVTPVFEEWLYNAGDVSDLDFVRFDYPTIQRPVFSAEAVFLSSEEKTTEASQRWTADSAKPIASRGAGLSEWIRDFHRDLMWPDGLGGRPVGNALVGIIGIVFLLALTSGLIVHNKVRKQAYTMRLRSAPWTKWQDLHKSLGLWGIPYFLMVGFTGAFLGVAVIMAQVVAAIAFKGDVDQLIDAIIGPPKAASGEQVQMMSLEEVRQIQHPVFGTPPQFLILRNYGDAAAEFELFYEEEKKLALFDSVVVRGRDGMTVEPDPQSAPTLASRVADTFVPLHYGTYGGVALKFIYLLSGLGLALIAALGTMMWVERRKLGSVGSHSKEFYEYIGRLGTGVMTGLPVSILALFYADRLYAGLEATRIVLVGWCFFICWAVVILFAFVRRNDYATVREMLVLTGALALGVPILNGSTTGDWINISSLSAGSSVAWVDFGSIVVGLALMGVSLLLPKARANKKVQRSPM